MSQIATVDHALYRLESEILKLPQVEMPTEHSFCRGLYARTMRIPAGTVLTGAVHRDESFFVVRAGSLIVTDGGQSKTLHQGDMVVTPAGSKRAGVALTDVIVTTFHHNAAELRDPAELWDAFTLAAPAQAIGAENQELLQ